MRWIPGTRSDNLEDRRGFRGGRGLSLGGAAILLILSLVFKRDFFALLGAGGDAGAGTQGAGQVQSSPQEEKMVDFVSFVLDSTQAFWARTLREQNIDYRPAKLVLFRDEVESACGFAQAATGPFYCPGDEKVYVDLGFFAELDSRFGAKGDFAQAYVLAHEIGHHVQHLTGLDRSARGGGNAASVKLELQADCLAGAWGHEAARENILEAGDADEGLGAAAAVGDDRLQKMSTGRVSPESFTHGSSAQRMTWFKRGLSSGRLKDCDTSGS